MNIPCIICGYDPNLEILNAWRLILPFEAVSQNALKSNMRGRAGFKYRNVRDRYIDYIAVHYRDIPRATTKRRVFFTRYFAKPKRSFDRDNLIAGMKPLRDSLTHVGLLVDDDEKHLESHYLQKCSDVNQIVIEIEDIKWLPTSQK